MEVPPQLAAMKSQVHPDLEFHSVLCFWWCFLENAVLRVHGVHEMATPDASQAKKNGELLSLSLLLLLGVFI